MKRRTVSLLIPLLLLLVSCSQNGNERDTEAGVAGTVVIDTPYNIEMVFIPAGSFMMGATNADDEQPIHEVRLDGFYIGKYVVTQREWTAVVGSNPSVIVAEDHPVESVSWYDVQAFIRQLSERTGMRYRLPTEAEWEFAARAGSTTNFHFGNDTLELGEYGWYESNSGGTTHPVGQKKPNAWGLYDVAGNVREWCQDWWDPGYYARSVHSNPINNIEYLYTSPTTGESFVVRATRSGSFLDRPAGSEIAHRHGGRPDRGQHVTGFRLAREVSP